MFINTQTRGKMVNAALNAPRTAKPVIKAVSHYYEAGSGVMKVKDWNANLSLKTYNALKRQGIMA